MAETEDRAEDTPRPHRWRRRLIWIGGILLVAAALEAIQFFFDPVSAARLELRLRALRRAGGPVTLGDLAAALPTPRPENNAALLYAKAGKLWADVRWPGDFAVSLPFIGIGKRPPLGDPLPPEMDAAAARYLAAHRQALSLVHQAAALDGCRFAVPTVDEDLYPLAWKAEPWSLRDVLDIECQKHMDDGRFGESAESVWAALRMAHAVRKSATCWWNADDATSRTLDMLARLLARHRLSIQGLKRLEDALRAESDPLILERELFAERAWAVDSAAWARYNEHSTPRGATLSGWLGLKEPPALADLLDEVRVPALPSATDRLWHLRIFDAALDELRRASPTCIRDALSVSRRLGAAVPLRCDFACGSAWRAEHGIQRALGSMARSASARVALAALRYRAANGRLPDELAQLVPEFLDSIPLDPYSGDPLRFVKEPDGFVVYAVGENGEDDGGWTDYDEAKGHARDVGFRVRWPKGHF